MIRRLAVERQASNNAFFGFRSSLDERLSQFSFSGSDQRAQCPELQSLGEEGMRQEVLG